MKRGLERIREQRKQQVFLCQTNIIESVNFRGLQSKNMSNVKYTEYSIRAVNPDLFLRKEKETYYTRQKLLTQKLRETRSLHNSILINIYIRRF